MALKRRDWALLAIAAGNGHPLSPVQLQKSLFVLRQELGDVVGPDYYAFEPYNYGPFDSAVYRDAESLERDGLVSIEQPTGQRFNEYRATQEGIRAARTLENQADIRAVTYLRDVVAWAGRLSFAALVRAIYARYPEYRVNSVFSG